MTPCCLDIATRACSCSLVTRVTRWGRYDKSQPWMGKICADDAVLWAILNSNEQMRGSRGLAWSLNVFEFQANRWCGWYLFWGQNPVFTFHCKLVCNTLEVVTVSRKEGRKATKNKHKNNEASGPWLDTVTVTRNIWCVLFPMEIPVLCDVDKDIVWIPLLSLVKYNFPS